LSPFLVEPTNRSGGVRTAQCPMRRAVSERLLASLDCRAAFGGSQRRGKGTIENAPYPLLRLCEERSDEAVQGGRAPKAAPGTARIHWEGAESSPDAAPQARGGWRR